jgi:hypothetical protein
MKTICTFCNTVITDGMPEDNRVSHGVCQSCYRTILKNYGFNLQMFLNMLDAPVFLVDADASVLAANTLAIAAVRKPVEMVRGRLCGTVLDCINAFLPEGCGKTPECPDCTIRNCVNETFETGIPIKHRHATIGRKNNGTRETIHLLVSTEKDGKVVLLRLEPAKVV